MEEIKIGMKIAIANYAYGLKHTKKNKNKKVTISKILEINPLALFGKPMKNKFKILTENGGIYSWGIEQTANEKLKNQIKIVGGLKK